MAEYGVVLAVITFATVALFTAFSGAVVRVVRTVAGLLPLS